MRRESFRNDTGKGKQLNDENDEKRKVAAATASTLPNSVVRKTRCGDNADDGANRNDKPPTSNDNNSKNDVESSTPPSPQLYYPSYFHYKCHGRFASNMATSSNNKKVLMGSCIGIASRLQHVRDLHRATKEDAIQDFQLAAQNYHRGGYSGHPQMFRKQQPPPPFHPFFPQLQQYQETQQKNGNNTEDDDEDEREDDAWAKSPAIIYHKHNKINNNNIQIPPVSSASWSGYGGTEIHVLVLRDAKTRQEQVVGISPHSLWGISLHDVRTTDGQGSSMGSLRVGDMRITTGVQYEYEERSAAATTNKSEMAQPADTQQQGEEQEKKQSINGDKQKSTALNKSWNNSWTNQMTKLLRMMKVNSEAIRDSFSDDFPSRVVYSGERIVNQFGKTAERTGKVMAAVYRLWRKGGGGDDDDE